MCCARNQAFVCSAFAVCASLELSCMAGLGLQSDLDAELSAGNTDVVEPAPNTPPPRKKRGKGERKSGKKGPNPNKTATKRCRDCGKVKASSEFYEDQSRCKPCSGGARAMMRVAEVQGCKEAVASFKAKNPAGFEAMQRSFNKQWSDTAKSGSKINFSCLSFIREWEKREGFKDSELGEFMWEGEFMEFAQTAKMGFLSKPEREKLWQDMLEESWRPRDKLGPRGYLRLWVKTKDQGERYSDISASKKLQLQEHTKKPTEKAIRSKMEVVFGDAADDEISANFNFDVLKSEALKASGHGGKMDGLMQEDLTEMMQTAQAAAARKKQKSSHFSAEAEKSNAEKDDESDSQSYDASSKSGSEAQGEDQGSKKNKGKGGKGKGGGGRGTWYDAETKNLKAQRDFTRGIDTLKTQMDQLEKDMSGTVAEFRQRPCDAQAGLCSECRNPKQSRV